MEPHINRSTGNLQPKSQIALKTVDPSPDPKMSVLPPRSPSIQRYGITERRASSPTPIMSSIAKAPVVLGVCAMDVKARSKAMREILTRLVDMEKGGVDVKIFGDPVILEEG